MGKEVSGPARGWGEKSARGACQAVGPGEAEPGDRGERFRLWEDTLRTKETMHGACQVGEWPKKPLEASRTGYAVGDPV